MKNESRGNQSGHLSVGGRPAAPKETIDSAVPMHHRLKLGQTDGVHNPQGAGQPPTDCKINGGKGW